MKKIIFFLAIYLGAFLNNAQAQDVATLLKEGLQLERSQKEIEALDKYKLVLSQEPTNITALVKAA